MELATPSIEWVKLDLRNIPRLSRQIQQLEELYYHTQALNESIALDTLRRQIQRRVAEVKEFAAEHEDDPRSVLLAKQAIQLKLIIQTKTHANTSKQQTRRPSIQPTLNRNAESALPGGVQSHFSSHSNNYRKDIELKSQDSTSYEQQHNLEKRVNRAGIKRPAWGGNAISNKGDLSNNLIPNSDESQDRNSPQNIIYSWEVPKEVSNNDCDSPTTTLSSPISSVDEHAEPVKTMARVTVRLSESDFNLVRVRQQIRQAKACSFKHRTNKQATKRFLFSSEEYCEEKSNSLALRDETPEKWIDPNGFKRSAKEDFENGFY